MSSKTKIYFAAPLFTQGEWIWNKMLTEALIEKNIQVLLPQERAIPMLSGMEVYDPLVLFNDNISQLESSNFILAIFDQADPDSGTSWECGYAYKIGIPIIGLRTDLRRVGDDPDASTNLMLSKCCKKFIELPFDKRDDINWIVNEIINIIDLISEKNSVN